MRFKTTLSRLCARSCHRSVFCCLGSARHSTRTVMRKWRLDDMLGILLVLLAKSRFYRWRRDKVTGIMRLCVRRSVLILVISAVP
eukprot:scaffold328202_cov29-Prasinocladus_malaysianus.AAC.1